MEFKAEEEAKENERSPSVDSPSVGLFSRGMVYELEQALLVCDGFFSSMSATNYGVAVVAQSSYLL